MNSQGQQVQPFQQYKQARQIQERDYCMLLDQPCEVIEIISTPPNKHGHSTYCFTGINICTKEEVRIILSHFETVMTSQFKKYEAEVANISEDNFISLILKDNTLKEDAKLPTDKKYANQLKTLWRQNQQLSKVYFTIVQAFHSLYIVDSRIVQNN